MPPEPVYLISIWESCSRVVLASKISPTQNQWDYLEVLFVLRSTAGVPKAIVSDGGGIFYALVTAAKSRLSRRTFESFNDVENANKTLCFPLH